jgi:hypothetical protein
MATPFKVFAIAGGTLVCLFTYNLYGREYLRNRERQKIHAEVEQYLKKKSDLLTASKCDAK